MNLPGEDLEYRGTPKEQASGSGTGRETLRQQYR